MIERYALAEMTEIWSERRKLAVWKEVESLVVEAWAELGVAPAASVRAVRAAPEVDPGDWKARESATGHDLAAFVDVLEDTAWPQPLLESAARALLVELANVPDQPGEDESERLSTAAAEHVSLQLPEDLTPELLDAFFQESPAQAAELSERLRCVAAGTDVEHPLLEQRDNPKSVRVLVLSSNRGLCGGYNASILRAAMPRIAQLQESIGKVAVDVSGKRGINGLKFRGVKTDKTYLQFEDQPAPQLDRASCDVAVEIAILDHRRLGLGPARHGLPRHEAHFGTIAQFGDGNVVDAQLDQYLCRHIPGPGRRGCARDLGNRRNVDLAGQHDAEESAVAAQAHVRRR